MYINVDLKDAPDTYEGRIAPKVIYDNIIKHGAQHRVLVTSFHKNKFNVSLSITDIAIGASRRRSCRFLKFNGMLGHTFKTTSRHISKCQLHIKEFHLLLRVIQWLNLNNIVPGYYGVNSIDLMTDLYHKGVHTLVTDRPDLVNNLKKL